MNQNTPAESYTRLWLMHVVACTCMISLKEIKNCCYIQEYRLGSTSILVSPENRLESNCNKFQAYFTINLK